MTITNDLRRTIDDAGHAEVTDPQTHETYVLIRKEVPLRRMQSLVGLDAGPLTIERQRALLAHAGKRAGWDDPTMGRLRRTQSRSQSSEVNDSMTTKTVKAKSAQIGTAMLEQLAEVQASSLSPRTARTFLQVKFARSHQKRVDHLSDKAKHGTLTHAEAQELDEHIHVGNLPGNSPFRRPGRR